jgi:hypothetical protein
VPKAGGIAGIRYVAAAEPDQPDNHGKRDREQRNEKAMVIQLAE